MKKFSKFIIHHSSFILFFFVVFILLPITYHLSPALGAPHISGKRIPGKPKDYVHKIPDVQKLRAKGLSPRAIQEAIGATGTKKVAVILVNFASAGTNTNDAETMTSADITGFNTTFTALKNFFKEVSYNQLNLEITFFSSGAVTTILTSTHTPYTLNKEMSWYGQDTDPSLAQLVKDALNAAGGTVTKTNYECVMVAHAGYGNESTAKVVNYVDIYRGDIWSAFIDWSDEPVNGFTEGTIVPARESGLSPIGVTCHEFGHQLGLPDLYNTNDGTTQVGEWCLMDMGTWANAGANPSHPSIWCKQLLSWVNLTNVNNTTSNIALSAIEVSSEGIKIPIPAANNEYFLLEYRNYSIASYDRGLPASGLLIWHIDDNIGGGPGHWDFSNNYNDINNNSLHRRIDLEEADSTNPYYNNKWDYNYGDSTDPWPGTKTTFTGGQATAYNSSPSGITILNFAGVGNSSMSFSISFQPWISGFVRDSAGQGIISGIPIAVVSTYTVVISTTDTNGQYLVSLASGTYTLIPSTVSISGTNYSFYPSSRTINLTNYLDNQDFTATRRMEIVSVSGEVIPENNVFNPTKNEKTTIWYNVPESGSVKMQVYTFDGLLVKTLVDDYKNAGYYPVFWSGENSDNETVASGIYLLYFEVNGTKQVKKIAIVK